MSITCVNGKTEQRLSFKRQLETEGERVSRCLENERLLRGS